MDFFNSSLAMSPPMGWNSWDCFSVSITEEEFKANAVFMAEHLKAFGWEYVVLDLGWYLPNASHTTYKKGDIPILIDEFGRLIPCPEKFPSSADGKGLKPLIDFVHDLGLKFGLHIMRGIPKKAVALNSPIKGTSSHASSIAYNREQCPWFNSMDTLNFSHPNAQAYYDSIFELYAEWGVDFIKADDVNTWHEVNNSDGSPTGTGSPYRVDDIEGISKAISKCSRSMLLSLSPGGPETTLINHLRKHANMWRISADFWDEWGSLKKQMERCATWAPFATRGHWPDADMLPIGFLPRGESGGQNRASNFTQEECYTLMNLWCLARSPLMLGADMTQLDSFTLSLLTNETLIEVNQECDISYRIIEHIDYDIWLARNTIKDSVYIGLFNKSDTSTEISLDLDNIDYPVGLHDVFEVWGRYQAIIDTNTLKITLQPHDSAVFKFNP